MLRMNRPPLGRRASVSAELALVSVLFLLPLIPAAAQNLTEIISAQAQANTALRALYSFAWANPGYANTVADPHRHHHRNQSPALLIRLHFRQPEQLRSLNPDEVNQYRYNEMVLFFTNAFFIRHNHIEQLLYD